MADYRIQIGTELDTKGIDASLKKYQGKPIEIKAKLDTSSFSTTLGGLNLAPVDIKSELNTTGWATTIRNYGKNGKGSAAVVNVKSDLSTDGITTKLANFEAKPINVGVDLRTQDIKRKISDYNATNNDEVEVGVKLVDNAIKRAIEGYIKGGNVKKLPVLVELDDNIDFTPIESRLGSYEARTPLKVNVALQKGKINDAITAYNQELAADKTKNVVRLNARLTDNAVSDAISNYKIGNAEKLKIPIDLTFKGDTEFDAVLKQKIAAYENTPVEIPVRLKPAEKNYSSKIDKIPIYVDATLKNPQEISKAITDYTQKDISISARLIPAAKGFDNAITSKPIKIRTALDPNDVKLINDALTNIQSTTPITIKAILDDTAIDTAISEYQKKTPTLRVNIVANDNDIDEKTGKKNAQAPIKVNVELDPEGINAQIEKLKTSAKVKVGVDLDFASHKGGQKGVPQQIREYKTKTKIKVGVELDKDDIAQQIGTVNTDAPIKLGVKLDPNGIQNVENQINNLRQRIQALGNVNINIGDNRASTMGASDDASTTNGASGNAKKQVDEVTQAYRDLMGVLNELNSKRLQLNRLDASSPESSNKIQQLRLQIEQLDNEYNNLMRSFSVQGIQFTAEQWNQLETAMARVGRRIDVVQAEMSDKSAIQSQTQAYKELLSISKEIGSLEINIAKLKGQGGNSSQIEVLENQLRELQSTYQQLVTNMSTPLTSDQWSVIYTQIAKTSDEIERLKAKHADVRAELAKDVKDNISNGSLQKEINDVRESFSLLRIEDQAVQNDIIRLQTLFGNMDSSNDIESVTSDYQEFLQLLDTVKNKIGELQRTQSNSSEMLDLKKESAMAKLNNLFEEGSQAAHKFGARAKELARELNACGNANVDNVTKKIANLGEEVKKSNLQTKKFTTRIKEQFSKYTQYLSVASVFMYATQAARNMFEQVKLIDSAMTELKKVTDETDASYNKFLKNAASRAKEIGTTIDGLVSSTADFARLGYGFKDAQGLAEVANIYAVVGDEIEGVEGATESLISTMAAFKGEMSGMNNSDFAMSIVDKFNEIGNNFAISSGGIGEAMERSASAMVAANNTIDETIALITAANTVTQNPEVVGTAFKTMSMRIRGAKTEMEEAGIETEGMVESTAKLRQEIIALSGVDIMLDSNTFKSTYQILDELAVKWKDLTDIQQASIIELIAGKRQGNVVSSLMNNFQTARDALNTSLNSSGSAMEEHAKWSESLEARLNKLKAAWQSFAQSFMDSDTLKIGIDAIKGLVESLGWLVDNFGLLGTIGLGVLGKNIFSYFKGVKEAKKTITDVANGIEHLTEVMHNATNATNAATNANMENAASETIETEANAASVTSELAEAEANVVSAASETTEAMVNTTSTASELSETEANAASTVSELAESEANAVSTASELAETEANAASVTSELAEAEANAASATSELAESTSSITSTATDAAESIGNLSSAAVEAGASAAKASGGFKKFFGTLGGKLSIISAVVAAIGLIYNAYKKAKEAAAEARQEVIESSNKYLDAVSSFEQAYIKYSDRTDLTAAEEDDLASTIKGTVDALNDKSSALQNVVNSSNDYVASLEKITDAEIKEAARAAQEKQKNAKLELEDATKDWHSNNTAKIQIANDSDAFEIAKEMDTDFFKKETKGKKGHHVATYWFDMSSNADADEVLDYYYTLSEYRDRLLKVDNFDTNDEVQSAYEKVNTVIEGLSETVKAYEDGLYDLAKAEYQVQNGIPKTTEAYLEMREAILAREDIARTGLDTRLSILNSLDSEYKQLFDLSSAEAQARKFVGIIEGYGDGTKDGTNEIGAVETFLNMRTAVNNNECTVDEYLSELNNIKATSETFSDEEKEQFNLAFGIDTDTIKEQYDNVYNYIKRNHIDTMSSLDYGNNPIMFGYAVEHETKRIQDFLNGLSASELAAVVDIKTEIDWENTSIEDIRKQIADQVKINEALSFETSIEVDKTSLELLNTALEESASAIGLSEESIDSLKKKYSELEGYNPHTLFEKTANGVKVNREELVKLEKKYNDLTKTEVQEHLDTLADAYNDVTAEIDECTNAGKRAELLAKREMYADQIEELATYQAQLEGVTGAYQKWIDAQGGSEDYEGYESIATSKEDIQDEIDRGFISNKGKAYIDLLSGESLEGKPIDDYYNAWKKLDEKVGSTSYSIHDFFTVNDDGDITSTGVDRFFKGLQQDFKGSVAEFNDKTGEWEYDFSQENLQKIQDEWGIGIEAIELLLEAAASAGYDVDWGGIFDDLDLDTSNFESLVSVAEAAQKELNKLEGYEDLDFNFSTTTVEAATSELEKAQKTYNELVTNDDGTINLKAEGADNVRVILATLLVQKQQLEDSEIAINISTSGLDDSQAKAVAWVQDFRTKYKNLEIAISTGEGIEEAKTELETVKTSLGELDGDTAKIAAQLVLGENTDTDGEGFKTQVNNAIDSIGKQDINVGFKLDETDLSSLNSELLTNFTVDATAKITEVDKSQLEAVETSGTVTWQENVDGVSKSFEATGTVNWDDDVKNVKTSFSANGTVNWTSGNNVKVKVISEANGTANADGTANVGRAFARGNWGIRGSGTALVGELGMETLVRGGRFYTIGDNGAEFIRYRSNDIIFNHKQTEELFKNGKVTSDGGRGRMFANGSAFAEGTALWQATASGSNFASSRQAKTADGDSASSSKSKKKKTLKKDDVSVTTNVTKSDDATSVNTNVNFKANVGESDFANKNQNRDEPDKDKKEFEETFDWIEIAISRVERAIDQLDQKVNNVYKSWSDRNSALTQEIGKVGEEIKLQEDAADEYWAQAGKSLSHDSDYAKKIREGSLDIEDFEGETDEKTLEKIKDYQKWYELYLACTDAAEKLRETESELYEQRFENVQAQYEGILQGYEHTEAMLNEYISQAEAKGHIVSKNYYQALIDNEKSNIAVLQKEQADLIAKRDEAVASGAIVKGSQAWYDMCAEIDGVTQAIEEGNTSLIEYANSMRDIDWQVFDLIQERISDITAEADFLIELMSNKDLFDDNGSITAQGAATMALHGQNYNTYMYAADDYGKEISNLDSQIAKDPYNQDLINRRRELVEAQRESILAAEGEKNAIKDLVEEGINLELDALQERIDLHNEELDSMKDLYDYQKNVEEQTKNIASLRKQLGAYEGFDDEETRAKVQELKVSLEEAESDLKETEYDKFISDQTALLDTLYTEYETILNSRLDNIDLLLEQVIDGINIAAGADGTITTALGENGAIATAIANAVGENGSIKTILNGEANNVGTTLSTAMNNIWSVGEGNAKSVLTKYGEGFQGQQTTTNTVLGNIKADVAAMVDDVDKEAKKKVEEPKTKPSAKANPTKGSNGNNGNNNGKKPSGGGDGKPKVGDKVKFVNGQYYYDSQGKKPLGAHYRGKEVYITKINTAKWATHPYHISTGNKLGKGDLGWLKLNQLSGYATGKHNLLDDEYAWTQEDGKEFIVRPSDGAVLTPVAKGDSILTSAASNNIWDMANSPAEFIRDNLNLGSASVPNNSSVQSNYTQHLDNVVFNFPNVKNYDEMLSAMQKDKNFERLVLSMSIDRLAGKSSLAKGKSVR